jgi:type II secretory ATPase GspE/PulE/Tfp pilus assembly ATPase PilB-like protein
MPLTETIGRLILEKKAASVIQKLAMEEGMLSMKQDGYIKVLDGTTTMAEVKRVAEY